MEKINKMLELSDEELYCQCMEENVCVAPEEVINARKNFAQAIIVYIDAVSQSSFADGFRYAVNLLKEV